MDKIRIEILWSWRSCWTRTDKSNA